MKKVIIILLTIIGTILVMFLCSLMLGYIFGSFNDIPLIVKYIVAGLYIATAKLLYLLCKNRFFADSNTKEKEPATMAKPVLKDKKPVTVKVTTKPNCDKYNKQMRIYIWAIVITIVFFVALFYYQYNKLQETKYQEYEKVERPENGDIDF